MVSFSAERLRVAQLTLIRLRYIMHLRLFMLKSRLVGSSDSDSGMAMAIAVVVSKFVTDGQSALANGLRLVRSS